MVREVAREAGEEGEVQREGGGRILSRERASTLASSSLRSFYFLANANTHIRWLSFSMETGSQFFSGISRLREKKNVLQRGSGKEEDAS